MLAQASATVKVNVWSLDIAKAATGTSFTRTYNWSLGKPDPASLKVHVREQAASRLDTPPGRASSISKSTTCAAGTATSPNSCSIQASIRIVMFLAQT